MERLNVSELEGGAELCAWYEGVPSFHDATLLKLVIRQEGASEFVVHGFRMRAETDERGYFLLDKHFVAEFLMRDLVLVELHEFRERAILCGLEFDRDADGVTMRFESSYGVEGRIKAKRLSVTFTPGEPREG